MNGKTPEQCLAAGNKVGARHQPDKAGGILKIAIIGGAGVRVPLLVGGFARSDLRIAEIALYDIDQRSP